MKLIPGFCLEIRVSSTFFCSFIISYSHNDGFCCNSFSHFINYTVSQIKYIDTPIFWQSSRSIKINHNKAHSEFVYWSMICSDMYKNPVRGRLRNLCHQKKLGVVFLLFIVQQTDLLTNRTLLVNMAHRTVFIVQICYMTLGTFV